MDIAGAIGQSTSDFWQELIGYLPRLIAALVALLLFYIAARVVSSAVQKILARTSTQGNVDLVVGKLIRYTIDVVGVVAALAVLRVNLTALLTGLGLAGFAVGFATKDVIGNFLSGILILIQRPFTIGDVVQIENVTGTVENVRVRDTVIKTFDGRMTYVPNATVFSSVITNLSENPERRIDLLVGIDYKADLGRAIKILEETVRRIDFVLREPKPEILFQDFGGVAVDVVVRCWIDQNEIGVFEATSKVGEEVKAALEKEGIGIPSAVRSLVLVEEKE